jgi:hypothetical protein
VREQEAADAHKRKVYAIAHKRKVDNTERAATVAATARASNEREEEWAVAVMHQAKAARDHYRQVHTAAAVAVGESEAKYVAALQAATQASADVRARRALRVTEATDASSTQQNSILRPKSAKSQPNTRSCGRPHSSRPKSAKTQGPEAMLMRRMAAVAEVSPRLLHSVRKKRTVIPAMRLEPCIPCISRYMTSP